MIEYAVVEDDLGDELVRPEPGREEVVGDDSGEGGGGLA